MKKHIVNSISTIETTIGELVEVLMQVVQENGRTESENYELAAATLGQILSRNDIDLDIG
jgi:hypothetical protein